MYRGFSQLRQRRLHEYAYHEAEVAGVPIEKVIHKMFRDYRDGADYAVRLMAGTTTLRKMERSYGRR